MSTLIRNKNKNENLLLTKGSPEIVLNKCTSFINNQNKIVSLSEETKTEILN